jgi:hypothetical protein
MAESTGKRGPKRWGRPNPSGSTLAEASVRRATGPASRNNCRACRSGCCTQSDASVRSVWNEAWSPLVRRSTPYPASALDQVSDCFASHFVQSAAIPDAAALASAWSRQAAYFDAPSNFAAAHFRPLVAAAIGSRGAGFSLSTRARRESFPPSMPAGRFGEAGNPPPRIPVAYPLSSVQRFRHKAAPPSGCRRLGGPCADCPFLPSRPC